MSRPFFENLGQIQDRILAASHLLVGLNGDAMLMSCMENTKSVKLDSRTKDIVGTLATLPRTWVAIVSRRILEDVRALFAIDNLIYAGNHGFEIRGLDFSFREPTAVKMQRAHAWLARALAEGLAHVPGVIVENNSLTINVHCQGVAPSHSAEVYRHVKAAAAIAPDWFRVCFGKGIINLRPQVEWHRGAAMRWIGRHLAKEDLLTLYVGDDDLDENAFAALDDHITVKVGDAGATKAHFYVRERDEVQNLLIWLTNLKRNGGLL